MIPSTHDHIDNVSFSLILEATGSDVGLDFSTSQTPQALLEAFLNSTLAGQTNPLCYYISGNMSRATNACSISWTDITAALNGTPAGSPFRTDQFTLGASSGHADLPPGCCAVIALRADYGSELEHGVTVSMPSTDSAIDQGAPATHMGVERPRARSRGRLYFGPLENYASPSTNAGLLSSTFAADLATAVNGLIDTHNTVSANQFNVVNWSRRNASVAPYTHYFINEAFGYQRRRADVTETRVHNWVARV